MMDIVNNKFVQLFCFTIILLVGLYYFVDWKTKDTIINELDILRQKKNKKKKSYDEKTQIKSQLKLIPRREIDSYIDPAEEFLDGDNDIIEDDFIVEQNNIGYSGDKLNKTDINMRDIADGIR
jgi:hypothetical protein